MTDVPPLRVFLVLGLLSSCCGAPPDTPLQEVSGARFSVTRVGVFGDDLAYGQRRGIYVIIDQQTGKEYVGISGIGIGETASHSSGKTSTQDER